MTRVIRFYETGGPEVLQIDEIETQAPAAHEVRLRVKAIGLNRAESMLRRGMYNVQPRVPERLGYEASGTVDAVGTDVKGLVLGDAVSVIPSLSMTRWPSYGETATFPANLIVQHPASLSWEEAAAVWMQYVTAYGGLVDVGRLLAEEFVVITAASSSVGIAAIQIARLLGAKPIATTRSSAKRQALLDIGATHVINTDEEEIVGAIKAIVGSSGTRLIFDSIGGGGVAKLCEALAPGGMLIEYGNLSGEAAPFPAYAAIPGGLTIRGYAYSEIVADEERLARTKTFILNGLRSGKLKPVIARTFPFDEIVAAHRFLESNLQFGKIVITV
jgi:NADPH:quinone reductase-like Zn-dependent oxidoreductase